jgi:ketosteroid isomerase-like protein
VAKDTLRGVISEYSSFLAASKKAAGAEHWAGMLRRTAEERNDVRLAYKILSFFGGMGSINDVVFAYLSAEQERKYQEGKARLYAAAEAVVRADDTKISKVIIGLEERLARAWVKGNRRTIEQLLAEEWTVTDPSGRMLTKQQVLDETFASTERQIDSMQIDDVMVRVYGGDVAVATGRTTASGSYQGQSASVVLRFTDVFVRRGNQWRVVASQGTMVTA